MSADYRRETFIGGFVTHMASLGNPAPLGLLAFGTTTNLLMYVEMGWCEVAPVENSTVSALRAAAQSHPASICLCHELNAAGTRPQSVCVTNLNAVPRQVSFEEQIFGVAFFYGGLAQLIVGIMELFKGNSFAFAAFGTYGAYWMAKVPARLTRPRLCR